MPKTKSKPKAATPTIQVILATFDLSGGRPIYRRLRSSALDSFAEVTSDEYMPAGSTPLLDATAEFITDLEKASEPGVVTIGLLLDESGSMSGNRAAVVQGVNEFVAGMRDVTDVDPDASGKVLAVVSTDGYENASHELTIDRLRALIQAKEGAGWTFIFLGAAQDAWAAGTSYGYSGTARGQTVSTSNTPAGHAAALRETSGRVSSFLASQTDFSQKYAGAEANSVLAEDGSLSVNTSASAAVPSPTKSYGNVADALEKAAESTRSSGAA